jgi:electron transport complex protein RnfC
MRKPYHFSGGVHPDTRKTATNDLPIAVAPLLSRYVVPLRQHIGAPAEPVVRAGDRVLRGQVIGAAAGRLSAAVHAPTSGIVSAVEDRPIPHPSGLADTCIVIEADGDDAAVPMAPLDWQNLDPQTLRDRVRDLGLVGLGGAVFPSHIKLVPPPGRQIDTLILNGAECEPWITCDDRLMRERADAILQGAHAMHTLLGSREVLVGIEDNKPEAITAMADAARRVDFPVEVMVVPTLYPAGGGKQLTLALTGRVTPSGGLSTDVGVQVFNVGTAYSLQRALAIGEPLHSRIVTVTGHVAAPQNFEVRIGTPIRDLISMAGGDLPEASGHLIGGPMMGFDLADPAAPVVKSVNCVIAKNPVQFPPPAKAMPCIRCGQCARACPAELQPFELYWYARAKDFGKAQAYSLFDCIECGCCSFVCPSHIPLVDYYRFAKSEIWAREQEKDASDRARERHDFHVYRLEREKQEKAEKLGKKAAERLDSGAVAAEDPEAARKKAILEAAIARAQKAKAEAQPKNTDNLSPEQQREVAEIEARRSKTMASGQTELAPSPPAPPPEGEGSESPSPPGRGERGEGTPAAQPNTVAEKT